MRQQQAILLSPLFHLYFLHQSPRTPRSLNTPYSVTVSVGQSRHGLAGSSARDLKRCTSSVGQATLSSVGPSGGGDAFLAHCLYWQHPFLAGCRTEVAGRASPPAFPHHIITCVTAASARGAQLCKGCEACDVRARISEAHKPWVLWGSLCSGAQEQDTHRAQEPPETAMHSNCLWFGHLGGPSGGLVATVHASHFRRGKAHLMGPAGCTMNLRRTHVLHKTPDAATG